MYFLYEQAHNDGGGWVPYGSTPNHKGVVNVRKIETGEHGRPILCETVQFGKPVQCTVSRRVRGFVEVHEVQPLELESGLVESPYWKPYVPWWKRLVYRTLAFLGWHLV